MFDKKWFTDQGIHNPSKESFNLKKKLDQFNDDILNLLDGITSPN